MTALEKYVLDQVGLRTARRAEATGNQGWFADADGSDQDLLLSYMDAGVRNVLTLLGILRPTQKTVDDSGVEDASDQTGDPKNEPDARNYLGELVPVEQWDALVYWVMYEWYSNIAPAEAQFWLDKYRSHSAEHRFTGILVTTRRTFRSL